MYITRRNVCFYGQNILYTIMIYASPLDKLVENGAGIKTALIYLYVYKKLNKYTTLNLLIALT